jgi:RNA polymerase sigma factor (sigma-70 family)
MENPTLNSEICKHQSCLESFAMKFTANIEDANDLVQDTLIKAIRYHELYREGTNLKAWLYTIMRNTFINDYRQKQKRKGIMDITDDITSNKLVKSASNNLGENAFLMEDINKALKNLQSEYAIPFLKYFEGYKYFEIAEELQIPIGTVKTRIHCARQILKSKLKMHSKQKVVD